MKEFSTKDFLQLRKAVRYEPADFIYWSAIEKELIEEVALLAYRNMVEVINALFPRASKPNARKS